ncbi:glycosyltransferase family 4 protein [Salinimicrobium xinjiangense]|uniref:glycosyltransferase family 4 protein n=1 Tax=Salinimicrobium xinjiangense TaxID=438596 RepID=UPI0004203374|nr:glycosyltransferase family 4 protein [Salinimicrobium xinjiangense]
MHQMDLFKNLDIRVFPLGVDCNIFKPRVKKNEDPKLLYVGRIVELKGIHLAIDAVKKLVTNGFIDAHFDIIGPISAKPYFAFLEQLIVELQLERNVRFLGEMEHSELIPFLQKADLFTLPSNKETFGMVMIEAMACGTPVVAINDSGGPVDVIEHWKNGILTTPEDFSEDVLKYFKNEESQVELPKRAREKVEASYSLNATYQALEDSVDSVLNFKT